MKKCNARFLSLGLLLALVGQTISSDASSASGRHGIAATIHPLATEAAVKAMRNGGNAIDGAIAAALTLGVVDGHNSGIGGGCFFLIHVANGSVVAIDGRETAPAKASRDMFVRQGKADPNLSQTGALAAGVPGALAAYDDALTKYGRCGLRRHLLAAAEIAERGFRLDSTYAQRLAATAAELSQFPQTRRIFLKADGSLFRSGDILCQPDLATTYRSIAQHGIDWFYRGPFSERTESWMRDHGGMLSAADFAAYRAPFREAVTNNYRDCVIIGFPPPSSGGVHVAQILNILEHFDLRKFGPNSADLIHMVTEAMKLAFADRAFWLGDPDFAAVPRGLISREYAARLAGRIDLHHASPVEKHNTPEASTSDVFGKHTTHFCVADDAGNWVACTATINTSFGSKVVVPGTGVLLNNEMDDFSLQPGVANYFGLIGADANAVAPGKRPLSSMSPTFVLRDGRPIFSVGAAGGPTIISQVLLAIINTVDFGMPVEKALAQPRFHHQWRPDELKIERRIGMPIIEELQRRGHHVVTVGSLGAAQAIAFDPGKRQFRGSADPRSQGEAAGF
jgi:gamma-glutamyltranspeptidase/glutathione hydrolase